MAAEAVRSQTAKNSLLYRVAPIFSASGLMLVMVAFIAGIVRSTKAADYYLADKVARDGAAAGTTLLAKLEAINATQAWLLPLEFVGLSALLVGIALFFSTIMGRIRLRAEAMAEVLPAYSRQSGPNT